MGLHLNPGNKGFQKILRSEYVDKTGLIALINQSIDTSDMLTCISRPRRFGKSFAVKMLCAYYDGSCDSRELFDDKEIAQTEGYLKHLNQYHVVSLDITGFISAARIQGKPMTDVPRIITDTVHRELQSAFPDLTEGRSLMEDIVRCAEGTSKEFVFVIDEWDALIREAKGDVLVQTAYLDLLRGWFKNSEFTSKAVAAAYMTGILPIKKNGSQSAISDFREYTILNPGRFVEYTGFLENEVRSLCDKYGMDFDEVRRWYDGYEFIPVAAKSPARASAKASAEAPARASAKAPAEAPARASAKAPTEAPARASVKAPAWARPAADGRRMERNDDGKTGSLYNPYSVMLAMEEGECRSYWRRTSASEALMTYINMDFDGMQEIVSRLISGEEIGVKTERFENDFETFKSRDDVLTLLIHLGYLTWNRESGMAHIPNEEIREEFRQILDGTGASPKWMELLSRSRKLLSDTLAGNGAAVAAAIDAVRQTQYAPTFYNNEQALRYVIKFAYIVALDEYLKVEELPSGKGIADVVYIPKRRSLLPALVIELKWNRADARTSRQTTVGGTSRQVAVEGASRQTTVGGTSRQVAAEGASRQTTVGGTSRQVAAEDVSQQTADAGTVGQTTAAGAIAQIKDRNYPAVLQDYGGEVLLVGICYDEAKKTHSCEIERYVE